MKQQHRMKIKSMQKFVPFLSKLLERLKTESGNENKIAQMQLFLDLLISPDASVTVEELDKCEHELSGLYETYESDAAAADALSETQAPREAVDELPTQQSPAKKTEKDDECHSKQIPGNLAPCASQNITERPSQDGVSNEEPCETKKVDEIVVQDEARVNYAKTSEDQMKVPVSTESSEISKADTAAEQRSAVCADTEIQKNSSKELKDITSTSSITDEESKKASSENPAHSSQNEENKIDEEAKIDEALSSKDRNDNSSDTAASGDSAGEEVEATLAEDCDSGEAVAVAASEESDYGENEENVEIVKYPEIETDEMILPDSAAEEETNTMNSAEEEEKAECQDELNDDEDPTAESELVAYATASDSKDDEKTDNPDPLNVEESASKNNKSPTVVNAAVEDDDDDDDVQVIETRNSPICVDSDDDDDEPPVIAKAAIAQKPSKKLENLVPKIANKSKPSPIPQKRTTTSLQRVSAVIDTIDLLDSSDDEKPQYSKPALISPVKRCLLPKPIRQSKRKRSPTTPTAPPTTNLRPSNRIAPKPPTQLHISTPQSNFLNAVNLQPANTANPPAFSAQLFNKNVIIPNAFYGNPPDVRSKSKSNKTLQASTKSPASTSTEVTAQQEKVYRRWLDNFLINFASPLQIVSNSCFQLLQRVLKPKFFQKVKEARSNLNIMAQRQITNETPASLDIQLMLDLRNALFNNEAQLSETGIKFCEFATTQSLGKTVPLTTDIKSGRVTSRTRFDEEGPQVATSNKNFNGLPKVTLIPTNGYTKKNKKDDTDEYTPKKPVVIASEGGDSVHGERKRSLRTNRSKRYDNNFSYNEDQHDDDEDDEEEDSYAAIARKIEQKRQEAKQMREKMAKSFESAFIEAFSKQIDDPDIKRLKFGDFNESKNEYKGFSVTPAHLEVGVQRGKGSVGASVGQYEDADSLDDGPREHRIYKVAPTAPYKPSKRQSLRAIKPKPSLVPEVITCSDGSDDNDDNKRSSLDLASAPKNTNRCIFMTYKNNENSFCIICRRQVQRIVHHYVNQHRGCEVYTSRLSSVQLTQLRSSNGNIAIMSPYKNGQNQYEATCPFCQKRSRFMLSYWYQHFTMHTGEYSYRCGGCGTRKPTRSLLIAHLKTPCKKGASVCQDFTFEAKTNQIEARICTLCNYIQMHRGNVVQHLRKQHGLKKILPNHIQSVVLLKIPAATPSTPTTQTSTINEFRDLDSASSCSEPAAANSNSNLKKFFDSFEDASAAQFNYEDDDPSDDLSFMICGMLDVQMNTD